VNWWITAKRSCWASRYLSAILWASFLKLKRVVGSEDRYGHGRTGVIGCAGLVQQWNPAILPRAQMPRSNVGQVAHVPPTPWVTSQEADITRRLIEAACRQCLKFIELTVVERQFVERQFIESTVSGNDLSDLTVARHYYGVVITPQCTAVVLTLYLTFFKCKVCFYLSLVSTGS